MGTVLVTQPKAGTVWTVSASGGALTLPQTLWPKAAGPIAVATFQYVSLTASAGDTCTVTDGYGNALWTSIATGADWDSDQDEMADGVPIFGLVVTVLTSGTLYVRLR